ncbi:MAG TPA: recombinase family protein [Terriglobia bacterium]|nr:recombinase family protein [Terriglobia bacterium]
MRVALYARVSTLNGQNPETQLMELREYAARRGWEAAGEYVDAGVSGSKDSRPSLNRLMAHAHQRKFDAICVWKLDRFGRSLKHLVTTLSELEALGVTFVSLKDNWDLSTPSGRLMFQIVGAMAEFERSLIRERIRAGMRRRKLEGYVLGRAPLSVDHEALVSDRLAGMSLTKVAKKYGVSRSSVVRFTKEALKRESATITEEVPMGEEPMVEDVVV